VIPGGVAAVSWRSVPAVPGGNAAVLAHEWGRSGLMADLVAENIVDARRTFAGNRPVSFVAAEVTPDNINDPLAYAACAAHSLPLIDV